MEENEVLEEIAADEEPVTEIVEGTEAVIDTEMVEGTETAGDTETSGVVYVQELSPDYTEVLNTISDTLTDIAESNDVYISTYAIGSSGNIDGYFFSYGSDKVYIPYDKVSYFSETEDGQLINLSSGTVTCYAVAADGTTGTTYRFPSFGTAQRYIPSGNYYSWESISVYADDSNLVLGQTGINNITDMLLYFILIILGVIAFVRRK